MAQTVLRGKPSRPGVRFGSVTLHARCAVGGCSDNRSREADQTAAGASAERWPGRKVRTAQGSAAANGCPPRGEDQSNRDESGRASPPGCSVRCRRQPATGRRKPHGHGERRGPHSHPCRAQPDPGETGNLCAQQHRIGTPRSGPGSVRVGGIEPAGRPTAQRNGGHARRRPNAGGERTESGLSVRFTSCSTPGATRACSGSRSRPLVRAHPPK